MGNERESGMEEELIGADARWARVTWDYITMYQRECTKRTVSFCGDGAEWWWSSVEVERYKKSVTEQLSVYKGAEGFDRSKL
jgi:hypothetical protein